MSHEYDERGFPAIPEGTSDASRAVLESNRRLLSVGRGDDFYRRTVADPEAEEALVGGDSFRTARDHDQARETSAAEREDSFVTARGSLGENSAHPMGPSSSAGQAAGGAKRGIFSRIARSFTSAWSWLTGGRSQRAPKPKKYPWMKPSAWNAAPYRAGVGRNAASSGGRAWTPDATLDMPDSHVNAWEANTDRAFELMKLRHDGAKAPYRKGRRELEAQLRSQLSDAPGSKRGDANRVSGLMRTMLKESPSHGESDPDSPTLNAGTPLDGILLSNKPTADHPGFIPPAVREVFRDFNPNLSDGGAGVSDYRQADIRALHPSIDQGRYNLGADSHDSDARLSDWAGDSQPRDDES